jgi:hypothetical protein
MFNLRRSALFAILALAAVSSFGQNSSQWRTAADISQGGRGTLAGTVADVDEARSQIQLDSDDPSGGRVVVTADALTTQYNGFGGMINGQPEIFTGSPGFANVRVGDRLQVRGTGAANGVLAAEYVTLLGRPVPSPQTGVGTTRPPSSISTPTATTTTTSPRVGLIEGIVQQVNAREGRIVIVTDHREIMTVSTPTGTPVHYRNNVYRVTNLETGDRIRIEPDTSPSGTGEVRARSIEVTRSVEDASGSGTSRATSISGRVSRIDRNVDMVTVDTGRQQIRVNVATASDNTGHRVRAIDFQAGDQVNITGHYGATNDLFVADSVRWNNEPPLPPAPGGTAPPSGTPSGTDVTAEPPDAGGELPFVTIYGTIKETLANAPQITLQDSTGRLVSLNVLDDFLVRNRTGGTTTADQLRAGDKVTVKAYRDAEGNYIAQTIRIR